MPNPLFGLLGGGKNQMSSNNPIAIAQKFQQFKQSFKGDPRQQVQDLLNSGQMTQDQLNQLMSMAQSLQGILK